MSVFLLEEEGKKALFDIDLNEKTSKGIPDRLKRAQGFRRWNWLYTLYIFIIIKYYIRYILYL